MASPNVGVRARIAVAVAAREASDYARSLVGDVGTPMLPGERIRTARTLRVLALTVLDRTVLVERAAGSSWDEIAAALCLSTAETVARYEQTADRWAAELPPEGLDAAIYGDHTIGLRADADPEGTAAALDAWYGRHSEPWDDRADRPVTRALG